MSSGDACEYLNVGRTTFTKLVKNYDIPHVNTKSGKIFLRADSPLTQSTQPFKVFYEFSLGDNPSACINQ